MPQRMWDRYTEPARRAVWAAHAEAEINAAGIASTDHLLLGILASDDNLASSILRSLNIDIGEVRTYLGRQLNRGSHVGPAKELSVGARRAIFAAQDEADRLGHAFIQTGHLLLGVLSQSAEPACRVLRRHSVRKSAVRKLVGEALLRPTEAPTLLNLLTPMEGRPNTADQDTLPRAAGEV